MRGLSWSDDTRAVGSVAHPAGRHGHRVRTAILMLLLIFGLHPVASQVIQWQTENVDDGADLGSMTGQNIGITSDGTRHVALGLNRLRHLWHDGSSWQMEVIDPSPYAGAWASLEVDADDQLHVAYYESGQKDLRYARFDGSAWQVYVVDSAGDVGSNCSLALDQAGRPHILYQNISGGMLCHARWDGATWEVAPAIGVAGYIFSVVVAIDSQGNPHACWREYSPWRLRYGWSDGHTWRTETIVAETVTGSLNSIALDSNDIPHITFEEGTSGARHAWRSGDTWTIESVPVANTISSSILVDSFDRVHVIWGTHSVIYTWRTESGWHVETVRENGYYQQWGNVVGLLLDHQDLAHCFFNGYEYDGYNDWQNLEWARRDDAGWITDDVPTLQIGSCRPSAALDNSGDPWLAYDGWGGVWLSSRQNGAWRGTQACEGYISSPSALQLASDDTPRIVFRATSDQMVQLRLASLVEESWSVETIDTTIGDSYAACTDEADRLHVTFQAQSGAMYGLKDGDQWRLDCVDAGSQSVASICLDSADAPHISYRGDTSVGSCHAWWDGLAWHTEQVGDDGPPGAIVVDGAGCVHLAVAASHELRYVWGYSGNWSVEVVDTVEAPNCMSFLSPTIALDPADRPLISYSHCFTNPMHPHNRSYWLRFAWKRDGEWQRSEGPGGSSVSSLAVDSGGGVHIAFHRNPTYGGQSSAAYYSWTTSLDAEGEQSGRRVVRLLEPLGPVPSRGETRFRLNLAETDKLEVSVFDLLGRRVRLLGEETLAPGMHIMTWDGKASIGSRLPSGTYVLTVQGSSDRASVPVVIVR